MNTDSPNRRIFLSCLVISVVICLCLSVASILGAGLILFITSPDLARINQPVATDQTQVLDVDQQMEVIERQVSELRGLEAKSSVSRHLLTPVDLRQHILDDFLKDYSQEEARQDALSLWSFGLLERDFKLYDFYIELYSEQVAGFYDQETKEMFVVQGEGFAGPERLTYAHEFTHALQDQYYDIQDGLRFNDTDCENESERCAAISALLEGDATLAELEWFSSHATAQDRREISSFYNNYSSPVFDSAPQFMQDDFLFPYEQGQDFVKTIFDEGGWQAVD